MLCKVCWVWIWVWAWMGAPVLQALTFYLADALSDAAPGPVGAGRPVGALHACALDHPLQGPCSALPAALGSMLALGPEVGGLQVLWGLLW